MSNTVSYKRINDDKVYTLEAPSWYKDVIINRHVAIREDGTIIQVVDSHIQGQFPYRSVVVHNLSETHFDLRYHKAIDESEFNKAYLKCLQSIYQDVACATALTDDTIPGF